MLLQVFAQNFLKHLNFYYEIVILLLYTFIHKDESEWSSV